MNEVPYRPDGRGDPHGAASPALSQASQDASDRRFTLDDLLSQEGIGNVRISPNSRWVVIERQAPWNAASTYKYAYFTRTLLSRLEVFSSADGSRHHVLDDPEHASGFAAGPFSPSGERMVVYRLAETGWAMGVMSLATGVVHWLDLSPELPRFGQTVAWRSETQLLVVACHDGDLPGEIGRYAQALARQQDLWRRADNGRSPSSISTPSGASRDSRERAPLDRLLMVDLASGRQSILIDGEIIDFAASPDGRSVAALVNGSDIQDPAETVLSTGFAKQVRRLIIADVETGTAREPLPDQDFASHLLTWSPRSDRVLAYARDRGGRFEDGRFWTVSRSGRASTVDMAGAYPLLDRDAQDIPIARGSWLNDAPVVQGRAADGGRVWLIARAEHAARTLPQQEAGEALVAYGGATYLARSTGLWSLSDKQGAAMPGRLMDAGTTGDLGARGDQNLDADILGKAVLLDQGCLQLAGKPRQCLEGFPRDEAIVATAPNASFIVTRRRSPRGATEIVLRGHGAAVSLATVNANLDSRDWGTVVPVAHPGPDGRDLHSWLLLPAKPSHRPPPLAVIVYPGNVYGTPPARAAPGALNLHINAAILSSAGYAVLFPSLPRDQVDPADFSHLGEQLVSIVAAACAEGRCDAHRAGLIGHSFGGPAVLHAAAQTSAFKAIVASNGSGDLSQMLVPRRAYRLTAAEVVVAAGWLEGGQAGLGVPLGIDPQRYVDHSALYEAGRIRTPTLLIESELDGSGFGSLFGALYRLNREAALVSYFGESHEFVSPANVRDLHLRILDWLDRYLGVPDALDPRFPVPRPGLQNGEDQEPVRGGVPD